MDDTRAFVQKMKETQAKDERNRRTQGEGTPSEQLPTKQHSKNP